MKILFNIPVHENMDVVVNTVDNIQRFVQDPCIVFHVNPVFTSFDPTRLAKYTNVVVNPDQFEFVKYHSILHILMANYYYTSNIEYDYHCFFYSNEMFIRPGIEDYVRGKQCVIENIFGTEPSPRHKEMWAACKIKDFFQNVPYINNHVEGTMYSRELMEKIFNFIETNLFSLLTSKTSIEETVIPTLAYMFTTSDQRQDPYNLFQDWDRELTIEQLHNVLTPGQKLAVGNAVHGQMGISDQIYTIKPVHRRMQSPLRQVINRL